MKIELAGIELARIGAPTNSMDAVWSRLELRFYDYDAQRYCEVATMVPVPKRPDVTWSEMQNAARAHAIEVFRESLLCLESNSFLKLEDIVDENKSKQEGSYWKTSESQRTAK